MKPSRIFLEWHLYFLAPCMYGLGYNLLLHIPSFTSLWPVNIVLCVIFHPVLVIATALPWSYLVENPQSFDKLHLLFLKSIFKSIL